MSPLIELQGVTHWFDKNPVLDDVSLSVSDQESVVLVGPSGSGKSLILKMMAGLLKPRNGMVRYQNKDISTLSKIEQRSFVSQVGMVFQQNALFDSLTVYQNLEFALDEIKRDLSQRLKDKKIYALLEAVNLEGSNHLYPNELSGGMQKRLGIARALVLDPKIVFFDDPTAGLDPITSRQIVQMMLSLQKEIDTTMVTVTHDMFRAYQLAGTIYTCFNGKVVRTGSAEETKNHPDAKVQQFMTGSTKGPLTDND